MIWKNAKMFRRSPSKWPGKTCWRWEEPNGWTTKSSISTSTSLSTALRKMPTFPRLANCFFFFLINAFFCSKSKNIFECWSISLKCGFLQVLILKVLLLSNLTFWRWGLQFFQVKLQKKTFQILNIPKMMTRNDLRFQTYMFNSFFFETLLKRGYAGVKRWTRKVDIFSYDIILVPIHLTVHWCMAVRFFLYFSKFKWKEKGKNNRLIEFSFLHPLKPMWLGCSRGQVVVGWPFSSSLQHWPASNFKAGQFLRAARAKLGLHKGEATVREILSLWLN